MVRPEVYSPVKPYFPVIKWNQQATHVLINAWLTDESTIMVAVKLRALLMNKPTDTSCLCSEESSVFR